jgi:hypothetical protein
MHAIAGSGWVRSTRGLIFEAHRPDRVRLHDSALLSRIFFKRERTRSIDADSQGKVLNPVKKIEREDGRGRRVPGISPGLLMRS